MSFPNLPRVPNVNLNLGGVLNVIRDPVEWLISQGFSNYEPEQARNVRRVLEAARRHGVPEEIALGIVKAESLFKTDPKGNGGGLGQFLPSTARMYGTTQEELRKNPDLAADLVARYLADIARNFRDDPEQWVKASAGYFVGPGTIIEAGRRAGSDWVLWAEDHAQSRNWGSVVDYLNRTGAGGRDQAHRAGIRIPSTPNRPDQPLKPPDINSPQYTDPQTGERDYLSWSEDLKSYYEALETERAYRTGPDSQYLDDLISEFASEIEAGRLGVQKATELFRGRIEAQRHVQDTYASDVFKYGAPSGAKYIPGGEPGGYVAQTLGMGPRPVSGGVPRNPLQEALDMIRYGEQQFSNARIPAPPRIAEARRALNPPTSAPPAPSAMAGSSESLPIPTASTAADLETQREQMLVRALMGG